MMELRSRPARFVLFLAALTQITPLPPASAFFVPAFAPGTAALSTTKVLCGAAAASLTLKERSTRRWPGTARREKRGRRMSMQAEEKNLFDYIREEDVEALRRYVERGGAVHVADTLGDTSLLVAASTGNAEVVKVLTAAKDADVNYPCFHGGETPLMVACTEGHLAVAECLVEAGADVNAMNHRRDTALNLAAFWGRVECLKFLLALPEINTEIENIQGKRAGEGFEELMRDESNDEETLSLMKESRVRQGITRL